MIYYISQKKDTVQRYSTFKQDQKGYVWIHDERFMGLLSPACGVAAKDWAAGIFIQASFCVWLSRGTEDSNTFVGQLIRCGDLGSCDDCISIFTT